MSCERFEPDLIGYHFGTLEPDPRQALEQHLLGCTACVRAFVELKRAVELPSDAERPSELARQRLRRAVVAELAGAQPRRWRRWERPFAFGMAAAAVLVALFTTQALLSRPGSAPLNPPSQEATTH